MLGTDHPVYALTRSAARLQHLQKASLAVIDTDITDPASVRTGLVGVWALFINTLSDYSQPEGTEERLLKSLIDAAAQSGVEYLVMSTLPEGMPARAYIEKSRAMAYARKVAKKTQLKPIFVHMGWYMSGFTNHMNPVLNPIDNVMEFRWSTIDENTFFPLVSAATDLGPVVRSILEHPDDWVGIEVPVVGDVLTAPQIAEVYSKVKGKAARAVFVDHIPQESLPSWTERHKGYREVGYFPKYVGREHEIPDFARRLYPQMKSFEDWAVEVEF